MKKIRKNGLKPKIKKLPKMLETPETAETGENAKNIKNAKKAKMQKIPKVKIEIPSFYICGFHLFHKFSFWY